jgi:C1A family cysteine protease
MPQSHYGWKKDAEDPRDFSFKASRYTLEQPLPQSVDLRGFMPPIYDQSTLGSCTANAIGAAIQFEQMKQKITSFEPSRLFIYYNERLAEGTVSEDAGAQIRTGIKVVNRQGFCADDLWPYDIAKFTQKPTDLCYQVATGHQSLQYRRLTDGDLNDMKLCLASGFPFVFGISVFASLETDQVARTGVVPMPGPKEEYLGGHAILAAGYDDSTKRLIIRNSWGTKWGQKGYFTIPYEYVQDSQLASDFWTIQLVS